MIFFDDTKAGRSGHHSGIQRLCRRLRGELAALQPGDLAPVEWRDGGWVRRDGEEFSPAAGDWLFTPELFSEADRPGMTAWIEEAPCRTAAVYYDAIPLKLPQVTWPQSVARHPGYLKTLARFERVLAISRASAREIEGYWDWARAPRRAQVAVIPLGADGGGRPRIRNREVPEGRPEVVMIGIVEPRKNQTLILAAAERLWSEGVDFTLHLVGRVNPHFGRPIEQSIRAAAARRSGLRRHGALADEAVADLLARARLAVFPSLAEGNGLPVIEALWSGVPCVCSDIAALTEHAQGGGCVVAPRDDAGAWAEVLRGLLTDDRRCARLTAEALNRPLPTWSDSAAAVAAALGHPPAT